MMKVGSIVTPRWFIPGHPIGLLTDTRCVVLEVRKRDKRLLVRRDDERFTQMWWVDIDAVRVWGES